MITKFEDLQRPHYVDVQDPSMTMTVGYPFNWDTIELKMDGNLGWCFFGPPGAPPAAVVMGELIVGTQWALRSGIVPGTFAAFDLLQIEGVKITELPLAERRSMLAMAMAELSRTDFRLFSRTGKLKTHGSSLGTLLRKVQVVDIAKTKDLWYHAVQLGGYEGLVFKRSNSLFGETWGRAKREATMDYIIIGFTESKAASKAGRMVKSIRGGLLDTAGSLVEVCDVGGVPHETLRDMYASPSSYIGRVFEAKGKGLFDSGALRHPAFVRFRDDKKPTDCRLPASA